MGGGESPDSDMASGMAYLVHNERVKLRANGTANVGTAFIVAGRVAPLVTGHVSFNGAPALDLIWIALGYSIRRRAVQMLGKLRE